MAGNQAGGKAAAQVNNRRTEVTIDGKTIKIEPGEYYSVLGRLGGKTKVEKGFAVMDKQKTIEAGAKGGRTSRRKWTEEERLHHGQKMREAWSKREKR